MRTKLLIIILSIICYFVGLDSGLACPSKNQIEIIFGVDNSLELDKLKAYCSEESCIIRNNGKRVVYMSQSDRQVLVTVERVTNTTYLFALTIPTLVIQKSSQGKRYYIDSKFDPKKFNWAQVAKEELELLKDEKILVNVSSIDISDIIELLDNPKRSGVSIYYEPSSCAESKGGLSQADNKHLSGWLILEGENCIEKYSNGCSKIQGCDCPRYIYYKSLPSEKIDFFGF